MDSLAKLEAEKKRTRELIAQIREETRRQKVCLAQIQELRRRSNNFSVGFARD